MQALMKYIYAVLISVLIIGVIGLYAVNDQRNEAVKHITALITISNEQLPNQIAEDLVLNQAYRNGLDVVYEYSVLAKDVQLDYAEHEAIQKSVFIEVFCETPTLKKTVLEEGVRMLHLFKALDGTKLRTYIFSIEDCND